MDFLTKTKEGFFARMTRAVAGKSTVDDEVLDNLEEMLISSDVGVETTLRIIERINARVKRDKYMNTAELQGILREEIAGLLAENDGFGGAVGGGTESVGGGVAGNGGVWDSSAANGFSDRKPPYVIM
ncbi:MAG: signal recognition particle receptor subunit alpha, partial [Bacteroidales bacterium]|nr:signal recognition particle receptor subunit alpha [Bacteroidales bacterium]